MSERGASEAEITRTLESGIRRPVKFGRLAFTLTLNSTGIWMGKKYTAKQLEVICVEENEALLVLAVVVKGFNVKEGK